MTETTPTATEKELVTIAKPGFASDEKDTTYYSEVGPLRFLEGRAYGVPLSAARKVVAGRPGWTIEPTPKLRRI
jgi:hypothetical protein